MGTTERCDHCGGELLDGCNGNGWERTAGNTVRRCPAGRAVIIGEALSRCGVPELYAGCTVDGFACEGMRGHAQLAAARDACRSYAAGFRLAGPERTSRGLLFIGPPGTGKTHLAAAVLQAIVRDTGARGLFVDFNTLCRDIRGSFGDEQTSESKILRPLFDAQILVLDELGAQRPTSFFQDTMYLVINTRYMRRLPTIFTTNHPLDGAAPVTGPRRVPALDRATGPRAAAPGSEELAPLSERVGPRIYSRLFELCLEPVMLDQVGDYRRRKT